MNPLQRTLIEKLGHDNGFEHVLASEAATVSLASARHRARVEVSIPPTGGFRALFHPASPTLLPELQRTHSVTDAATFHAHGEADLARLLRHAASLSQALPSQAMQDYQSQVHAELSKLPASAKGTEIERLVRQRIGQDRFRAAMLDYWSGACAVTGVSLPEVLRASHAKPWADCASDEERLDVFNGFLLCAHFDALFDRFLMSFDESGLLMLAPHLGMADLRKLGIEPNMKVRWLTNEHRAYLHWHRERFLLNKK